MRKLRRRGLTHCRCLVCRSQSFGLRRCCGASFVRGENAETDVVGLDVPVNVAALVGRTGWSSFVAVVAIPVFLYL